MTTSRRLVRAYVDETGDRGTSAKASQFFAMTGIVIADEDDHLLRGAIDACRTRLSVPSAKPLHWQEHVKTFPRRQFVARTLAAVPVVVNYVVFEKAAIPASAGIYADHTIFYNYVAGMLMERLLMTAGYWPGGARDLKARFGHVRGFDHAKTLTYFRIRRQRDASNGSLVPWHLTTGDPTFSDMGAYKGLQAADQYSGMLKVALCQDGYGGYEEQHLMTIRNQIRRRADGRAWGYGFKVMAGPQTMQSYPWWPPTGI